MDASAVQELISKIDTTKTVIYDYCPSYLQNRQGSKYPSKKYNKKWIEK